MNTTRDSRRRLNPPALGLHASAPTWDEELACADAWSARASLQHSCRQRASASLASDARSGRRASVRRDLALASASRPERASATARRRRPLLCWKRYHADGGLDQSFGSGGIVKTNIGGGDDLAENLAVQPDGRIVVVGRATSSTILDMALVRYLADGTLDTGFDGDGILTADFHGKGEFGQDVAIQPDGEIVAAGYTANGVDTEFALIRANP
jgi:uncharacterized delta-60 repeat protein